MLENIFGGDVSFTSANIWMIATVLLLVGILIVIILTAIREKKFIYAVCPSSKEMAEIEAKNQFRDKMGNQWLGSTINAVRDDTGQPVGNVRSYQELASTHTMEGGVDTKNGFRDRLIEAGRVSNAGYYAAEDVATTMALQNPIARAATVVPTPAPQVSSFDNRYERMDDKNKKDDKYAHQAY